MEKSMVSFPLLLNVSHLS